MGQVSNFGLDGHEEISDGRSALYTLERNHINSQKAISLPSSPHEYRSQTSKRSGPSGFVANDQLVSTWNKVLESPLFHNNPPLPFQEWHIDFSELTVGTRVGIGMYNIQPCCCFKFCLSVLQYTFTYSSFISFKNELQFCNPPKVLGVSIVIAVIAHNLLGLKVPTKIIANIFVQKVRKRRRTLHEFEMLIYYKKLFKYCDSVMIFGLSPFSFTMNS